MTLVVPDVGDVLMLNYVLNMAAPAPSNQILHLFSNDPNPGLAPFKSTTIGIVTEAGQAGYAPMTLTGTNWTITQAADVSTASYTEQTFIFSTTATIYGYYITNMAGTLMWIERFTGAPFQLPSNGGQIAITPKITMN